MKTAVITGGAGGLGRALSSALKAEGWHIIALDLDTAGLDQGPQLTAMQCDLTDPGQLDRAAAAILQEHPQIGLVIYNAGITQIGSFAEGDEESHRKVFEINYFSAVSLARKLLPAVRAAGGTHLAVSSVAGFAPLYHRTAYAASKHALEGFFKSLRSEEKRHGVKVQIAAPSFVATNTGNAQRQADGTARPGSAQDGLDSMTPEAAAEAILKGLRKSRPMIPVGRVAGLVWWINGLAPRLYQHLMERSIKGGADAE